MWDKLYVYLVEHNSEAVLLMRVGAALLILGVMVWVAGRV